MIVSVRADSGPGPVQIPRRLDVASTTGRVGAQRKRGVRAHENDAGFTLVELVIAVVLVGILTAVAIVGLAGVTKTGNKTACSAALDSAKAAATTYYANTGAYPVTAGSPKGFDLLKAGTPPLLTLPSNVAAALNVMSASGWSVTMAGGGSNVPNTYTRTADGGTPCT
jgi:prepilin-type N-terminal cleavage/methylation domain-containing protein